MKKKKTSKPKASSAKGTPFKKANAKVQPYRFEKFTLPTFRSPLDGGGEISFQDEVDHAFFLRCCELYRVLELLERSTDKLIDVYSKYRNRNQFTETLTFRYFDSEEALVALFDPLLAANLFFLFNLLYEMRLTLTYTDDLPLTVKKDIEDNMLTLRDSWNLLTDGVEKKYGWKFKKIAQPEAFTLY